MFRITSKLRFFNIGPASLGGIWSFLDDSVDRVVTPKFDSPEYNQSLRHESGWERVKAMFSLDEFGNVSPEVHSVIQAAFTAGFVGIIIGGVNKSKFSFNQFMEKNHATAFQSNFDAKKKLQSQVSIAFGTGGFRVGWRLAWFTTLYCGISTTISVYRGKSSIWEYIISGFMTGFLYKTPLGLRASLVGGTAGGILGILAGGVTLLILRATGTSIEEVRYWQYQFKVARDKAQDRKVEDVPDSIVDELVIHHSTLTSTQTPGIHHIDTSTPQDPATSKS